MRMEYRKFAKLGYNPGYLGRKASGRRERASVGESSVGEKHLP